MNPKATARPSVVGGKTSSWQGAHRSRVRNMNKGKAKHMFENARGWAVEAGLFPPYQPADFDKLGSSGFLAEYCHVVFASNFSVSVVHKHAEDTARAFKHFDLEALATTDSIDPSTVPIKNGRKVNSFLAGAKAIHAEGFKAFKARVKAGGMDELKSLKGIGDVTKKHLAMIVGLEDTAKDDVWLRRCAAACNASVESLAEYLATEFNLEKWCVDGTLWEYCRQNKAVPPTKRTR